MTWNDYGVPDMKLNMFPVLLFNPKNPMGSGYGWPHFRDEKTGPQRGQSCDQKEIKLGSELLWQKNVLSIITLSWFTKINIGSRMPGESKSSVISFLFFSFFLHSFFFFLIIPSQDYHLLFKNENGHGPSQMEIHIPIMDLFKSTQISQEEMMRHFSEMLKVFC